MNRLRKMKRKQQKSYLLNKGRRKKGRKGNKITWSKRRKIGKKRLDRRKKR
jgi:hypothetical protein